MTPGPSPCSSKCYVTAATGSNMKIADIITEAGQPEIYYFAYGMLTDPKLMQGVTRIGAATLPNHAFELLQFANVYPEAGSHVDGVLWSIDHNMQGHLDKVEGYPHFYDRKTVPVFVGGKRYEAAVYMMTPESQESLEGTWPKKNYVEKIVRGYKAAGVPFDQLQRALA